MDRNYIIRKASSNHLTNSNVGRQHNLYRKNHRSLRRKYLVTDILVAIVVQKKSGVGLKFNAVTLTVNICIEIKLAYQA